MAKTEYLITVMRCEENGMLVGTSADIPGLTIEADAPVGIVQAIREIVPTLLEKNLGLSSEQVNECSVNNGLRNIPDAWKEAVAAPAHFCRFRPAPSRCLGQRSPAIKSAVAPALPGSWLTLARS